MSDGPSIEGALSIIPTGDRKADSTGRRNTPPAEAEERYYAMLDEPDMAA
jgi:hypothetical protein